jgi:hypothetical protein
MHERCLVVSRHHRQLAQRFWHQHHVYTYSVATADANFSTLDSGVAIHGPYHVSNARLGITHAVFLTYAVSAHSPLRNSAR